MMLSHDAIASAPIDHESSGSLPAPCLPKAVAVHHADILEPAVARFVPVTPSQLEPNQPTSRAQRPLVVDVYSFTNPPRNKWRCGSSALTFLLTGMNDAATGALIPYIEEEYHIGYAVVSLIFITYALGFVLAAPLVGLLDAKLGRARLFMLSQVLACAGFLTIASTPPFAVVVLAFLLLGFGFAIFQAVTNAWIVNLLNGTVLLSFCQGFYGAGGVFSPLVATAMVSHGLRWSRFYLISLGIAAVSLPFTGWAYHDIEKEGAAAQLHTARQLRPPQAEPKKQLLVRSLKDKTTLAGAIFIFFYQGAEVAISGWLISYLLDYRGGEASKVGNVTAGFWGGITLGRFILTPLAPRIGERKAIAALTLAAAVFQALAWAIPNTISTAVAESLVGLFLGPVYPCAMAVLSRLWPHDIQIAALSLVTSVGCSGGALVPFATGLLAQRLTTVVLHPIVLFSFAVMMVAWLLLLPQRTTKQG